MVAGSRGVFRVTTLKIQTRITGDGHKHVLIWQDDQVGRLLCHMLRMQRRPDLDWGPIDTLAVCRSVKQDRECCGKD